ncbi:MAG: hypothetical protein FJ395_02150 [Verrucomicrobia bacterium]|nr:hypothetical protein [Verrucomicrobiota bacterium]
MNTISRRQFLAASAVGLWSLRSLGEPPAAMNFGADAASLLAEWCDGLVKLQLPEGAFRCPACGIIHGRCAEAGYPLLRMASETFDTHYLDAAIKVRRWSSQMDGGDGSWQADSSATPAVKSDTVFGVIALAEALSYHGKLLVPVTRSAWADRLRKAIEFVFRDFHWKNYANINYLVTASYAFALCGRLLQEPRYTERGREFARKSLEFLTKPSRLLHGEGTPWEQRSPKGCFPIDLGYNVGQSLPALVQYGLLTGDEEVLGPVTESLKAHLEFMLPDGGWDNSWGTRSYNWTYWGSRTAGGCLPAYALLAAREPMFATAAARHLALLRKCTKDGLLHGGPHYVAHQVPPCVQHTFCHARGLASLLDHPQCPQNLGATAPLPRAAAKGIRAFPEINAWLAAAGPWRATVSGYDWFNTKPNMALRQATGGAIGFLWHDRIGPVLCASLAAYLPWEPTNMQPMKEPDFPLTVRLERAVQARRNASIEDGEAEITAAEEGGALVFRVKMKLLPGEMTYRITPENVTIESKCPGAWMIVPVIATATDKIRFETKNQSFEERRIFNPVPGFEADPWIVMPDAEGRCSVTISPRN